MKLLLVCLLGGLLAGIGTGLSGLSSSSVLAPILIIFLDVPAYQAIGIALASDVFASSVSAYTYGKNKNVDINNGIIMILCSLLFTMIGSYLSSAVPNNVMGGFSMYMTFLVGLKFIFQPVTTTKEVRKEKTNKSKVLQSIISGSSIGFICGFIGVGGGMMYLILLSTVLGYELKTAVGTSVFIMTFTALTGAVSHFVIDGIPDIKLLLLSIIFVFIGSQISSKFANMSSSKNLNKSLGTALVTIASAMIIIKFFK